MKTVSILQLGLGFVQQMTLLSTHEINSMYLYLRVQYKLLFMVNKLKHTIYVIFNNRTFQSDIDLLACTYIKPVSLSISTKYLC